MSRMAAKRREGRYDARGRPSAVNSLADKSRVQVLGRCWPTSEVHLADASPSELR
jgi:hypothetical protein